MSKMIDAATLKEMIRDGGELALLDVREDGQFGMGHLLRAVPLPYSQLELHLAARVPRQSTRTVLVDDGDGIAERAAGRMAAVGYDDASILAGGVPAWATAGHEIFQGVNVPSKAFGEVVEHAAHTPAIDPDELAAMQRDGINLVILDGRTPAEFNRMSIPGGISVPNAELVYRIHDIAPDPETTIVVNCAGRTRSIIGAQALINAGVPNRVVALRGGTMGWRLSGHELKHGENESYPAASPEGAAKAEAYADGVRAHFGVGTVDRSTLAAWRAEEDRTTYLLDVRSEGEYRAGHMPGSAFAPGGQLVQSTDQWCATWGARIVLLDDAPGARAVMTAHWLVQMGWDACVLDGGIGADGTETGMPARVNLGFEALDFPTLSPAAAEAAIAAGEIAVVDTDMSEGYVKDRMPGALWGNRARARELLDALGSPARILLYSMHESRARLMARELSDLTDIPIAILEGGREAWLAEGRALEATPPGALADEARIDFLFWVHDRHLGNDQAARDYLAWEESLPAQIEADGDAGYNVIGRAAPV